MDIQIQNLTKIYGEQKAVDNISFEVKTGEILGFLGPNGAGKSTTMKIITNYIAPSSGNVNIGGTSVLEDANRVKKFIGYLPENNPLYEDMFVTDYLGFCASLQDVDRKKIESRIVEMIAVCGLDLEKHKKIGELSKGYRQRVGLAQAMIHDPEILILDEPTSGLDPNQIIQIRELIRQLGKEKTVILSTHILPEVEATCDRILIINKGRIVADGTASTLRKQASGKELIIVKIEDGDPNTIHRAILELPTVEMVELTDSSKFSIQSNADLSSKREVFNLCVRNSWVLTEMIPMETRLEDIFKQVTMELE